jgi:uroporphyrinogen decarboxylase
MNSRERFLSTINRKPADRPPVFANFTPQVAEKMSLHLGIPYEEPIDSLLSTRISHMDLLTELGNDAVGIAANAPDNFPTQTMDDGLIVNEWGMKFKTTGLYNEFHEFPLSGAETKEDIDEYRFPIPGAKGRYNSASKTISKFSASHGIVGDLETSIFETAWYLTGMEKFFMDMMLESGYVEPLLDKIMQVNTEIGKEMVRMGADMIWAGDDFGSQLSMIMDPETWRKLFKPRIKWMFEQFRSVNPSIKIAWHSCGSIIPIIPDFIEIGLDILNPIQPLATNMTPEYLNKEFAQDLTFFGGIDVQDLLPNGTPEFIKEEVKRVAGILCEKGHYIIAPAHNIQDDTPVENIMAFFSAVKEL